MFYVPEELEKAIRDKRPLVFGQIVVRSKAILVGAHTMHSVICVVPIPSLSSMHVPMYTTISCWLPIASMSSMYMHMRSTIDVYTAKAVRDGTQTIPTHHEPAAKKRGRPCKPAVASSGSVGPAQTTRASFFPQPSFTSTFGVRSLPIVQYMMVCHTRHIHA